MAITLTAADAHNKLAELINEVVHNKEHIILTRRGKNVAAIISIEDLRLLQELKNKNDLQEAVEALKTAREKGSISIEQIKKEIGG